MMRRALTLEESKAMASWIGSGFRRLWNFMCAPLYTELAEDRREDPLLAIQFVLDHRYNETDAFLKCWSEGDWPALQLQWPEWVAWMGARGIDVYHEPRMTL